MIKKLFLSLIACLTMAAQAETINTASIIKDTVEALPDCLHYNIPTHFCFWMSSWGWVTTTPVLDHYLPDLIVMVYRKPGDNPWFEVDKLLDKAGSTAQEKIITMETGLPVGFGNHSSEDPHEQHIIFKEVEIVGNPALAVLPQYIKFILLPSTAIPLSPYYQSMLDSTLWRGIPPFNLIEESAALGLNFSHQVGRLPINWGSMYPHEGKILSDNDVKASAVIALRGADLLTNPYTYGHINQSLSVSCGKHCKAAPIQENTKDTRFQMIYPITQNRCSVLGDDGSYHSEMLNEKEGAYVWVIWRHYEGCADGDGRYIGKS